ncbi:WbqC family protein [Mariniflexile sp. HNIBRBA6329]|uniref:WbqC family protein n=1 Tax=Mariniflexile sp. HNIBRBA6329 TaxID=3373088 RepID=UPI0037456547
MTLGIMQPYIFPYIGYFQLINAVDTFVFYDDVNFIKGGWINRNRILVNNKDFMFTISLKNMSSFSLIKETLICEKKFQKNNLKFLKTIEQSYKNAPYFETIFPLLYNFLITTKALTISELAMNSIVLVSGYLNLKTKFKTSSLDFNKTKGLDKAERIIAISKIEKAIHYINPIGGEMLYNKKQFVAEGIEISFLKSKPITYQQFNNQFTPWLSIIDVLMFNSKEQVLDILNEYNLI